MLAPELRAPVSMVNVNHPAFTDNALAGHRQLRDLGPVVWLPFHRRFIFTSHADVARALRDPRIVEMSLPAAFRSIDDRAGVCYPGAARLLDYLPFHFGREEHGWRRRCFAAAMARYARETSVVERRVAISIDRLRGLERFDFVEEFSRDLFFDISCDLLALGDDERELVRQVSHKSYVLDPLLPLSLRAEFEDQLAVAVEALVRCVARRRNEPVLLEALRAELPETRRSDETLAYLLAGILLMGSDTTAAALAFPANQMFARSGEAGVAPGDWCGIADDAIRISSPLHLTFRQAEEDVVYAGVPIMAGEGILLALLAADTDPLRHGSGADVLQNSGSSDVGLAFGAGPHACIGSRFARFVVEAAFEGLASLPRMRAAGPAVMGRANVVRRMASQPVEFV